VIVLDADPQGLRAAADALAGGGIVAFPTDTVHGLACRLDDPAALERLFAAKGRPPERQIGVLVADLSQASEHGALITDVARTLAEAFWPGGLTMVLATAAGGTLGIREPDHPVARALLALTGPLPTTSANPHGMPECLTADDVLIAFAGLEAISVVVRGESPGGTASTVLDLTGERPRLIREGAISRARLEAVVGPID
jgi:tRNA threonylcarbamoyl adenosine modification protein (Sua5/YciO/YrdC/YwlC family)